MEGLLQVATNWILPAVFIWLVISFITMTILELIANNLRWRSLDLENTLMKMLGEELKTRFYNHPLIQVSVKKQNRLSKLVTKGSLSRVIPTSSRLPAYISPNLFSRIIIDWILQENIEPDNEDKVLENLEPRINHFSSNNLVLGGVLSALFLQVKQKTNENSIALDELKKDLESWFSDAMETTTDEYRRKSQLLAFVVGLVFSTIINFDVITMTTHLWKIQQLKEYVDLAEKSGITIENVEELQEEYLSLPIGWKITTVTPYFDQSTRNFSTDYEVVLFREWNDDLQSERWTVIENTPTDTFGWTTKILGIYTSAFLVMIGAQYIYDLLRKIRGR